MPDGPVINTNLGPTTTPTPNPLLANPFGIAKDMVEIRQANNANLLFQQQMSARTQFGALATTMGAQGASPDQIVERASKEPWGVYVAPEMGAYRQLGLLSNQIEQTRALTREANSATDKNLIANAQGAFGMLGAMGTIGLRDPSQLPGAKDRALASLPPDIAKRMKPVFDGIVTSVVGHNDLSTPEGRDAARHNLFTTLVGAGLAPDSLLSAAGGAPIGLKEVGGVMNQFGGIPKEGGQGGGGVIPASPASPASQPPSPPSSPVGPLAPSPHHWEPTLASPSDLSHSGEPLSGLAPGPQVPQSLTTPLGKENAESKLRDFNDLKGGEYGTFNNAVVSHARMLDVQHDVWELWKNGGFLTPGAWGNARENMARMVNTVEAITGSKPTFDPTTMSDAQDLIKNTKVLGMQLLTSFFGSQREAQGIIHSAMGAVPGIENTPRAAMMIGDIIDSVTQWQIGQRKFRQDYLSRNAGDLANSEVVYAQKNPVDQLVQAAIDKYKFISNVPDAAIAHLAKNPGLRGEFDAKYGEGKADAVLGAGGGGE